MPRKGEPQLARKGRMKLVQTLALIALVTLCTAALAVGGEVLSSTTNISVSAGSGAAYGTYYWTNTSVYGSTELMMIEVFDAGVGTNVVVSKVGHATDTSLTEHCMTANCGTSSNGYGYCYASNNAPRYAVNGESYKITSGATNRAYKFRLYYRINEH